MPRRYHHHHIDSGDEFETELRTGKLNDTVDRDQSHPCLGSEEEEEEEQLDGSDDEPEAVSFTSSKQTVLHQQQQTSRQIHSERQKRTALNKALEDRNKDQKKRKLEKLAQSRLPDDFLEGLSSDRDLSAKKFLKTTNKKCKASKTKSQAVTEEDDVIGLETSPQDADIRADFLPLNSHRFTAGVHVVAVKTHNTQPSVDAAQFRQNLLYGGRVRRESTQAKFAKKLKKSARNS